jgi:hypothetical protein
MAQKVQQHLFQQFGKGWGAVMHIWHTELVRIAILQEFDENDSSLPLAAKILVTLLDIFTHFTQGHKGWL